MEAVKNLIQLRDRRRKTTPQEHQKDSSLQTPQKDSRPAPKECKCGAVVQPVQMWGNRGWLRPDMCDECIAKERKIEEEKYIAKITSNQPKIEKYFKQSRLGNRFRNRTFDNFKVNKSNKEAYSISKRFVDSFEDRLEDGRGIIFTGNYGTGKTHLAGAILQEVIKQKHTGIFISVPDLIAKIRQSWDGEGNESELINTLTEADLIVFDDLGAENTKDWIRERLFVIINTRYEKMLPTVFTTNCNISELKEKLGGRIESRIYEMCRGVKLIGEDYRKSNLR